MQASTPPAFSTLKAAHGHSAPGPIACSRNASAVFLAEAGIEVLESDPTGSAGHRLAQTGRIETPSGSGGLHLRHDMETSVTDLLVLERDSGVRIFER
jgi:hypothetical protein